MSYHWEISWNYQQSFSHLSFEENMTLDEDDIPTNAPRDYIRLTASCTEEEQTFLPPHILEIRNWTAENRPALLSTVALSHSDEVALPTDKETVKSFKIYPNPAQQQIQVDLPELQDDWGIIRLISAQGFEHLLYSGLFGSELLDVAPVVIG